MTTLLSRTPVSYSEDSMLFVRKSRQISALGRYSVAGLTSLAALGLAACSSSDDPSAGAGGTPTVSGGQAGAVGTQAGAGGAGQQPTAGSGAVTGGTPSAGGVSAGAAGTAPVAGSVGQAGSGGQAHVRDHCVDGYDPDPSDATMADGPAEYMKGGQIDLTVQPGVLKYMQDRVWEQAHFQWHNIRRCGPGGMVSDAKEGGGINPCTTHKELIPANQEGKGPGDGLEFFAMHRHMIQALKQLFPKHTEQFEGFEHFPTKAEDVPPQWRADWSGWMSNVSQAAAKADDPAKSMSDWPTEGDFGQWIQTTSGLHGALHFKWVRTANQDHGLGNQFTNIDNYMFWKMHGWIDKVWDRYRAAKGQTPNDPDIKAAVLAQCRQMDQLALIVKPDLANTPCTPAPKQTGFFVDKIRPIFEGAANKCTGCHGRVGAHGNLTLGGSECVKSSDIVAALVNKPAAGGGQFKLVEPGQPEKSWLYLKVTDKAKTAGCTTSSSTTCNTQLMPFGGGVTLTQAEQDALKQWITEGAVAPQ
jgi:hypothetical protein